MEKQYDAVLEGGGVKGIGHVGEIRALEEKDYLPRMLAGSSAGAIVASLLAAGYTAKELHKIMASLEYLKFREKNFLDNFGTIGKTLSVLFNFGIYSADYLEAWLHNLLAKKHCTCFKDVKNKDGSYRLQVTTCDLTTQELLVLPKDLQRFQIDVDSFSIAKAVRMSMSIPIYYEPYSLKDNQNETHYLVDGGMLANYPIWILDDGTSALNHPVFALKFSSNQEGKRKDTTCVNIIDYGKLLVSTLLDANDNFHISRSKGDYERSILISSRIQQDGKDIRISTTDFDITKEESEALYQNGYDAGNAFIQSFDFPTWLRKYRK